MGFIDRHEKISVLALLFLGVFVYAIIAMAASREVVIPRMAASFNGDLPGDPQYYSFLAKKKVKEIREKGIGVFELQPEGQGPAGIASLLYLVWESPYSVVLINAFFHGVSSVVMVMILMQWYPLRASILGSLPLVISPYMIVLFSQLNKDTFALSGALLFTYGVLKLVSWEARTPLLNGRLFALCIAVTGICLTWTVRPYVNQILMPITGLIFVIALSWRARRGLNCRDGVHLAMCGAIVLLLLGFLGKGGGANATLESFDNFSWTSQKNEQADDQTVANKCFSSIDEMNWKDEVLFPSFVNEKLRAMMGQRCLIFTILGTHSNFTALSSIVDRDRFPGGSMEALEYLPRATILGVFSPWPDRWGYIFAHGASVFFTITPIEASVLYAGIVGLCIWFVRNRRWGVFVPVVLSVTVMTIYAMATPFLGALYRYRYPWWMLLICLGVAAILDVSGRRLHGKALTSGEHS